MRKLHRPLSDKVEVRVTADTSYRIKRAMEAVAHEKGLEMMSRSGIKKKNRTEGIRRYDVGVDANNFCPVSVNHIIDFFRLTPSMM